MADKKHIMALVGTRPEAVKMAPVIRALREKTDLQVTVCSTGQHREMLWQTLAEFGVQPDHDLAVMTAGQSLAQLSATLFQRLDEIFARIQPDWLLVQGDTTTAMIASLCAFYRKIKIGHVEAGLRSFNIHSPFPEEINRKIASMVADAHFAPTACAVDNLVREGVAREKIILTGNTVVDALQEKLARLPEKPDFPEIVSQALRTGKKLVLVTAHRRENLGNALVNICDALLDAHKKCNELLFIYPVHMNPEVRKRVYPKLENSEAALLTEPLPYSLFLSLMREVDFILTDSGGIQEEACVLAKPVLVLRDTTERQEGIRAGAARLLGTDKKNIVDAIINLVENRSARQKMAEAAGNLYGDGRAAMRIADFFSNSAR